MLVSLVYMLCVIRVVRAVRHTLSPRLLRSFAQKKWLFGIKLASTGGLLFFFWRHRVFCQPMAFSWFSLCEYVIATCNMLYHVSVALDFSDEHLIVGHIITATTPSASTTSSSISTTASSSRHQSVSTPTTTTTCDSLATCEGGGDTPPTRNGRLDEQVLGGSVVLGGPQPLAAAFSSSHPSVSGKVGTGTKCDGGVNVGGGGPGTGGASGAGGAGVEGEAPPNVVHQVLNTIHEGAEPAHTHPCLNGPADTESTLVQRRPAHSLTSNPSPTDAHPITHTHSE
ncbi:Post-GPI attachment to proteins factor 2-like 2 [Homarus americanus]|uniref:Post-GPI attachment to proteins factor 2-like 2 n=2 Tax=Homarus americanus TaxID=6706 RepID=A0A8J5JPG7_HOMAM|nr:Post-GPI attachment to proteins factor 2-like 2 [Homarus americanus]